MYALNPSASRQTALLARSVSIPRNARTIRTLDISRRSLQTTSMDQLAGIQAKFAREMVERDELSDGLQKMLVELGGEPLEGSGFEHEDPEPDFEEQEVS